MNAFRLTFVLALLLGAFGQSARAENWIKPFADDPYWWVDLDSIKPDTANRRMFKLHMGANPKGRYDAMLNYTTWHELDCSSGALYMYSDGTKTWIAITGTMGRSLMPVVCR